MGRGDLLIKNARGISVVSLFDFLKNPYSCQSLDYISLNINRLRSVHHKHTGVVYMFGVYRLFYYFFFNACFSGKVVNIFIVFYLKNVSLIFRYFESIKV